MATVRAADKIGQRLTGASVQPPAVRDDVGALR